MRAALEALPEDAANKVVLEWIDDFAEQQDLIPPAVARVLGVDRTISLARAAEAEGSWWSAALRWGAASTAARTLGATESAADEKLALRACANAVIEAERAPSQNGRVHSQAAKDRFEFAKITQLLRKWDQTDYDNLKDRLERLMTTDAVNENVVAMVSTLTVAELFPSVMSGNLEATSSVVLKMTRLVLRAAEDVGDDEHKRILYISMGFSFSTLILTDFPHRSGSDWDVSGPQSPCSFFSLYNLSTCILCAF